MWYAQLSTEAPRIPWDVFLRDHFNWKSGEHVAFIGPTGLGKTTMLIRLLPLKPYSVVFATKPKDMSMDSLIEAGYVKIERWQSLDPKQYPKRVLWPDATHLDSVIQQKKVFHDAFGMIYREGGWCVAVDETWYVDNILKLEMDIKMYLLQARALGISCVLSTQRPAWVSREIYSSSTWLFFWRTNDEDDLKSLSGIGYRSANLIRNAVAGLDAYQCLCVNTRTGKMVRTRCPALPEPKHVEQPKSLWERLVQGKSNTTKGG
jgi:energy-coupling factor transporter ATP-binding protein EcfA2